MSAKDQTLHGSLRRMIALTVVGQHDPSQMAHCPAKHAHRWLFHSRPVAVEASQQDRLQVGSLFLNVRVLASSQLFFESPQLGLPSLPHRLAHYLKVPSRGSSATVIYPNKVERSRLAFESMGKILKVRLEGLALAILAVYTCGPHHLNRKVSCSQSFDIEDKVQKRGELVLSCPVLSCCNSPRLFIIDEGLSTSRCGLQPSLPQANASCLTARHRHAEVPVTCETRGIFMLNARPVRASVNASKPSSRAASHDLEPLWFARPLTCETFITLPVCTGTWSLL